MKLNSIVAVERDFPKFKIRRNDVGIVIGFHDGSSTVNFVGQKQIVALPPSELRILEPSSYGDKYEEKICNVCHRILPTSLFDLNQNGKGDRPVRRPSCSECRVKIDGVGIIAAEKKKWQQTKPHLTAFECPICRKVTIPGLNSKVVLNHDHSTGKVTGWICDSCNTGLGRFKDDVSILENAIAYLLKFTSQD